MSEPKNGQRIATRKTRLVMSGSVPLANETVKLKAYNVTNGTWDLLTQTKSDASSDYTDPQNIAWYGWSATNLALPTSVAYWTSRGTGADRFVDVEVKATSTNYGDLGTFANSDDDCVVATLFNGGGGLDVYADCSSSTQARVRVPCGDRNEACCTSRTETDSCNSKLSCKNGLCETKPVSIARNGMIDASGSMAAGAVCTTDMAGAPCQVKPPECKAGTTSVTGKIVCTGAGKKTPVCTVTAGTDYCSIADNALCGGAAQSSCSFDEQCGPGTVCATYAGIPHVCTPIDSCRKIDGYCWLPKSSVEGAPPSGARNQDICL